MAGKELKFNWPRTRSLTAIGLSGLLMLISHQNCAPASGSSGSSQTATVGSGQPGGPIIQIDDGNTTTLQVFFPSAQTQLTLQGGAAVVRGSCSSSQDGSVLDWKLTALNVDGSQGSQIFNGYATCTGGAFAVDLTAANQLTCGDSYELSAQFGFVTPGMTVVSVPCAN